MTDFTDEMDRLAASLAKDANMAEKAFSDRLDAFKALMPYYALLIKNKGGRDDADDGLPNFDNFQAAIHVTENDDDSDEPGVRGSRRNGN
jgi:hypothetical protein